MHFVHKVPMKAHLRDGVEMVTAADVEKAQQAWGKGIVEIAAAHDAGMDYVERARTHVETLYAYGMGPVLFKPTFAVKQQFRPTFEGAMSYFVGQNGACPEDNGFCDSALDQCTVRKSGDGHQWHDGAVDGQLLLHTTQW